MKLQTRIFLLFTLSLALSLGVSVSMFLPLLEGQNHLFENTVIHRSLDQAFDVYGNAGLSDGEKLDRISRELASISREASRFRILRQDLFLKAGGALAAFCALQLLVLGILAFGLSRAVTFPWKRIHEGLRELESGNRAYRFSGFRSGDFARLAEHLNGLLDTVRENERTIEEQSNLLGWKEAAAFLAHQFRNPLAAIGLSGRNLALLLEDGPADRDLIRENIGILEDETRRLSSLMSRLRELTSFEKLVVAPLLLDELFAGAAERYASAPVTIRVSGRSGCPLPFDAQYMEQLFFNLVNNTIEACAERSIRPELHIAFDSGTEGESVVISDNVTGLPRSILEKIGTPRFTTKKNGTGLGVHIMKKIVSLHGGTMRTELSEAGGLVFSLHFPRRASHGQHSPHR